MTDKTTTYATETATQEVTKRKTYVKPLTQQVELRPQEAVLGACKADNTTCGPTSPMPSSIGS